MAGTVKGRLTGKGLYRITRKLGRQVWAETLPHGIRHPAVTRCCKAAAAANLDLSDVLQFSVQRQRKWESKWDFVSGEFGTLRSDH